jgi:hypothetical protein
MDDFNLYEEKEVLLEPVCNFEVVEAEKFDAGHRMVQMGEIKAGLHRVVGRVRPGVELLSGSPVKADEKVSYRDSSRGGRGGDRGGSLSRELIDEPQSLTAPPATDADDATADRMWKYIAISKSAESDSCKTSCLTALLLQEENQSLLECFRGEGKWHGHGAEAHFEGAPNWLDVIAKLESFSQSSLSRRTLATPESTDSSSPLLSLSRLQF